MISFPVAAERKSDGRIKQEKKQTLYKSRTLSFVEKLRMLVEQALRDLRRVICVECVGLPHEYAYISGDEILPYWLDLPSTEEIDNFLALARKSCLSKNTVSFSKVKGILLAI